MLNIKEEFSERLEDIIFYDDWFIYIRQHLNIDMKSEKKYDISYDGRLIYSRTEALTFPRVLKDIIKLNPPKVWSEITPEFLERQYERINNTAWNYEMLTMKFWVNQIRNKL